MREHAVQLPATDKKPLECLYFGCKKAGHHLYRADGSQVRLRVHTMARYDWIGQLDAFLPPQGGQQVEGQAAFHSIHNFSIISFWDRSQDARPNSSSTFFISGVWTYGETLAHALEAFPKIFERIKFAIVRYPEG